MRAGHLPDFPVALTLTAHSSGSQRLAGSVWSCDLVFPVFTKCFK